MKLYLIDATESPIQRPKKERTALFPEKEKAPIKNSSCD
jgi:hypothetical protein